VRSHPASRRTPRCTPDEIRLAIERFLTASKQPTLIEPGEPPFAVQPAQFLLEDRGGALLLTVWDDTRSFTRRVMDLAAQEHRARIELAVERFGRKEGRVILADLAAQRNANLPKRGERMIHREQLRRSLARQYPGWRIAELTSEPDLEHSLSPTYPRGWLRKGTLGIAALAASDPATAGGALTFGLIWLDYLRQREPRVTTQVLSLFLPAGSEVDTALRMRYLDPSLVACELHVLTAEGYEEQVDPSSYNNIDTRLLPRTPRDPDAVDQVESAIRSMRDVETVELHDQSLSFRVRGLEFARRPAGGGDILFGIESGSAATVAHLPEIEQLVATLGELRSSQHRDNPLARKNPENWLESQVRANLDVLDADLCPEPVYGQAPAMAGARPGVAANGALVHRADRDVIDLLAIGRSGRLSVIELKAGEDIHLPMQGLDYWIRVKWHLDRGEWSGHFPGITVSREAPKLLLVCPALDVHPANERVLRFLSPMVEAEQIGVGVEWRKELQVMFRRPT
jgi:hypothetical protein